MADQKPDETYSDEETARRRDEAIRRALSTPPKPNSEYVGKDNRSSPKTRPSKAAKKSRQR